MGFRVLLIAVSGKDPGTIHPEYGVEPTDQYEEIPESPVIGAMLPSGAYLLYINDEIVPEDDVLSRLSQGASLIACYANETVMNSFASAWENGFEKWSVFHDCEEGIMNLETGGQLPPQYDQIRQRLFQKQEGNDEVDYVFDVPVKLFVAMGGIRYDQDIEGADEEPWQVLARV